MPNSFGGCIYRLDIKMAYFDKEFKFDKEENIEEFIEAIDAGDKAKFIMSLKPNQKLAKDGDDYVLAFIVDGDVKKEYKFSTGGIVEDAITDEITAKSTFLIEDDTITQVMDFGDKGSITLVREYSEDSLKVTLSTSKWDGTATRYYVPA